jgi:hypothetical protein
MVNDTNISVAENGAPRLSVGIIRFLLNIILRRSRLRYQIDDEFLGGPSPSNFLPVRAVRY